MDWKYVVPLVAGAACPAYAVQYLTVEQAREEAFPTATVFESAEVALTSSQAAEISRRSDQKIKAGRRYRVWQARRGQKLLGWLVADAVIGKHLLIDYTVAVAAGGEVGRVEILEYRENYGGEIRREAWRRQFVGQRAHDPLELDEDIRNITGATLSCRHVTEGVKKVVALIDVCF